MHLVVSRRNWLLNSVNELQQHLQKNQGVQPSYNISSRLQIDIFFPFSRAISRFTILFFLCSVKCLVVHAEQEYPNHLQCSCETFGVAPCPRNGKLNSQSRDCQKVSNTIFNFSVRLHPYLFSGMALVPYVGLVVGLATKASYVPFKEKVSYMPF